MKRLPVLIKESDFELWRVLFIDFIASRENGENMIKSFTEGPMIRTDKDYTEKEIKRMKADKEASSNLIFALYKLPQHFFKRVECFKQNPMQMWNELSKQMLGSEVSFKRKEEEKKAEKEDMEQKSSDAENETKDNNLNQSN